MLRNKIREARNAKGWNQQDLAERVGTTQQSIQRYEAGSRDIKASMLVKLSNALDVTVAYLLCLAEAGEGNGFVNIPLLGPIAAGKPLEMERTEDFHPIPNAVNDRWPNAFLLRIEGESMNRILPNGCYALVDPCSDVDHDNQPYAVRVGDLDATVKRVRRTPYGLELVPDSTDPSFHSQRFPDNESDKPQITIIGRVVWHCIPYDWSY